MADVLQAPASCAPERRGAGSWWRPLLIPGALLLAWALVDQAQLVPSRIFVPPWRVLTAPFVDPEGREIWPALGISIARMIAGFAVGSAAGMAFGFVIGTSASADRALAPSFHALRQITLFAWIPLLTAWCGNGEAAKLVYVALSAFFPIGLYTQHGLRAIAPHYREVADVLRLSPRQRFRRLLLPAALPSIVIGIQLALITAWLGTVGAEYAIGGGRGIGVFLAGSREEFRMDLVLAGVMALALVGYALNRACARASARLLPWQRSAA